MTAANNVRTASPTVSCTGILVVDALSCPLDEFPGPGRNQVVTESLQFAAGGGAANTASALSRMGVISRVFSTVGGDPNGAFITNELSRCGVDVSGIVTLADESTPFTYVGISSDGARSFIHTPGSNMSFSESHIDVERLLAAKYFLYQDCWVLPALDGEPGARLLAEARRRGVVTLIDECWGLGPRRDALEPMLPHCDYFMPSADDMAAVFPDLAPERVADELLSMGADVVMLKMGARGCLVARGSERRVVPSLGAEAVDTTGAGDCFNAGFIAGLADGFDLDEAARAGHACAAFCVEHVGGSQGIPSWPEVVRRAQ